MIIGLQGRFGEARVDHHYTPTAITNALDAPHHIARTHEATVRGGRIAANNQEIIRAVQIRHREQQLMPEQLLVGHHGGQLVD